MRKGAYAVVLALALVPAMANASVAGRAGADVKAAAKGGASDVKAVVVSVYHGFRRGFHQVFGCK